MMKPLIARLQWLVVVISALSGTTTASEPPVFNFSVAEEEPVGTVVGLVNQRVMNENSGSAVVAEQRYRLRPSSSSRHFQVHEVTGVLRTATVLDREELCSYEPVCQLDVHVTGTGA